MSVQKKFLCGFASFVLFVGLVGFVIGFFARPSVDNKSCCGAKNGNDDTSGMLAYKKEALDLVLAQKIRHYLKYFANQSHTVERNESCNQAQFIKKEWNSLGLSTVELKRYDVLLWYPKRPSKLSLIDKTGSVVYSSILIRKNVNALTDESRNMFPFSVHSASGVARGKLLYVNYGRENDFKYLEDRNISCTGKIVLLRYGKILEYTKVANAQKWNVTGVLLYLDPNEYGGNLTEVTWYPTDTGLLANEGDRMTPGYPATAGIYRESRDDIALSKVPVQPISRGEAETLLRMLNHTLAPDSWQGDLGLSYGIQMDPSDNRNVTLNVSLSVAKRAVCNVVGTIKGITEPDRYVLLGSPRSSEGTALLMEVTRVLISIRKKGWVPRRTIKICSWGGGTIGAVEWIEEYERVLENRAVIYLNLESGVQGNFSMGVKSSPLLEETAFKAAKEVRVLKNLSKTLYDEWKTKPALQTGLLPVGSGCLPFAYKIGVPCAHLNYRLNTSSGQSVNHSPHETTEYHVALAQVWLQMTFDISGSLIIPFNVVRYAEALRTMTEDLSVTYNGTLKEHNITLDFLLKAAVDFQAAAEIFQDCLGAVDKEAALQVRMANDRLQQLDRAFIDQEGLPGRPFMRHVVLAPSYFISASHSKFAGITDSIHTAQGSTNRNDWDRVRKQTSIAIHAFRSALSVLQPPDF